MAAPERLRLSDAELSRPALVLAQRFVQRWDLYALQLDDGRYICVHETLNVGHLFAHLRGEITLGTYLLDQESRARFLVLDADDERSWRHLRNLARALAEQSIPTYMEISRRGGHLWLFLAQAVAGQEARAFGLGLLAARGHVLMTETSPVPPLSTFVLRFWRGWSAAGTQWRGRIEHVQSGASATFLGLEGMVDFILGMGIMKEASIPSEEDEKEDNR